MPGPSAASKRKRPAFSPPRPQKSKTTASKSASKAKTGNGQASKASRKGKQTTSIALSDLDSTGESSDHESPSRESGSEPDFMLAEVSRKEEPEEEPTVPIQLLHTLLNHHFTDKDKMRISQDAKAAVGKYVDTFVREAIARSALERQQKSGADVEAEDEFGAGDSGWLEVEDLERMAPQLVLDF